MSNVPMFAVTTILRFLIPVTFFHKTSSDKGLNGSVSVALIITGR
jgi:hypothetical protein